MGVPVIDQNVDRLAVRATVEMIARRAVLCSFDTTANAQSREHPPPLNKRWVPMRMLISRRASFWRAPRSSRTRSRPVRGCDIDAGGRGASVVMVLKCCRAGYGRLHQGGFLRPAFDTAAAASQSAPPRLPDPDVALQEPQHALRALASIGGRCRRRRRRRRFVRA